MLWIQLGCFQTGTEESLSHDEVQEHPAVPGWILEKAIFGVYLKKKKKYDLESE